MDFKLDKIEMNKRKGPCVLIILDGVGIGAKDDSDAFYKAKPEKILKMIEEAKSKKLYTELFAHGKSVGLPTDDDMGNSEVGHNALGAGQIYSQGAKLVNESLDSGDFFKTDIWLNVIPPAVKAEKVVHFLGLLSDGNIHSHIDQLFKMMEGCKRAGIKKIRLHVLLDGRDVAPTSALEYIEITERKCLEFQKKGVDARIASGGGRMAVTMDRYYSDWKVVEKGWKAHVRGVVEPEEKGYLGYFQDAKTAIETARSLFPDRKDQFNPPFVIVDESQTPIGTIEDDDVVINFNYRGDRAIEISEAFENENFDGFDRVKYPQVNYVGLLQYDGDRHLPVNFLVPPPLIENVSSEYLCAQGVRSFAVAETHKYGHVTYFWNGNRSGYIDEKLEKYVEIESESAQLVEQNPQMKAVEVADTIISAIESGEYDYIRANFANGDMVGHTGNFDSCVKSVTVLDEQLERVVSSVLKSEGVVLITADHGNVEQELDKKGNPLTSHTLNKVPFFIIENNPSYTVEVQGINAPGIANVIATTLNLLGFKAPDFYESSLIKVKQ